MKAVVFLVLLNGSAWINGHAGPAINVASIHDDMAACTKAMEAAQPSWRDMMLTCLPGAIVPEAPEHVRRIDHSKDRSWSGSCYGDDRFCHRNGK